MDGVVNVCARQCGLFPEVREQLHSHESGSDGRQKWKGKR